MRNPKLWLYGTLTTVALGGSMLFSTPPTQAQSTPKQERREERNYWRHYDGRWSHWDPRDKRWYYTDGSHWYYHNGRNWELYRFDKTFGREGFERGNYAIPGPNANVVLPTHNVYVAPR